MVDLPTALLLLFTATAAVTDFRKHKIYNWTTYPGILLAFVVHYVRNGWNDEYPGLEDSLKGFAVCGGLMLVCFVFFGIGGGDVKLIAMMGAFLGLERGIEALLWTFVLGGALGLATLIWRVGLWRLVSGAVRHVLWSLRLVSWLPLTVDERKQLQPPLFLAPSALAAVVIVCFRLTQYL
ncbi:MAG: prepilin peptidase [Planctomycetia bacterium]|nr:prepilin peptidase [Planctomycetia bacterium]